MHLRHLFQQICIAIESQHRIKHYPRVGPLHHVADDGINTFNKHQGPSVGKSNVDILGGHIDNIDDFLKTTLNHSQTSICQLK